MIIPPDIPLVGAPGQSGMQGSLEVWRDLVGMARHSTAMMVALVAAFAAPLLTLLNRPSFALVFFGPSRAGKSTAQVVAASALGFGREEDLPSLNASPAGLLAAALAFNDHLLPINEVGTVQGSKSEIYRTLDERDSNVEKLAGLVLGVGRLYIGFGKWLLRIMIVVFGLIALGIWADNTHTPEEQHRRERKRAYLYRQGMPDPKDWNSPIPGCDLSLRY